MKKFISALLVLGIIFSVDCLADNKIYAKSAVLMEKETGKILFSVNPNKIMKPASITKIITAMCALERNDLYSYVKVSENAVRTEGSSMYLRKGDEVRLIDLVYGLMLNSGNDAAVAIAEYISKDVLEFSKEMNKMAKKMGAKRCNFVTPHGLDNSLHYVTARDMAVITCYALSNKNFCEIVGTKSKVIETKKKEKRYLTNHNKLLRTYEGCNGVKTGFTKASGRTLVSSATRNGITLVAVTLNDCNDWQDHKKLLDYGFGITDRKTVLKKEQITVNSRILNCDKNSLKVMPQSEYSCILFKNEKNDFDVKYKINKLKAPILAGEIVGYARIIKNGKEVLKIPLKSQESAEECKKEGSWEYFKRFFYVLWSDCKNI